jgi:hypothetical protein
MELTGVGDVLEGSEVSILVVIFVHFVAKHIYATKTQRRKDEY